MPRVGPVVYYSILVGGGRRRLLLRRAHDRLLDRVVRRGAALGDLSKKQAAKNKLQKLVLFPCARLFNEVVRPSPRPVPVDGVKGATLTRRRESATRQVEAPAAAKATIATDRTRLRRRNAVPATSPRSTMKTRQVWSKTQTGQPIQLPDGGAGSVSRPARTPSTRRKPPATRPSTRTYERGQHHIP